MCDEAEEEEEMMIGPFIQKHEKERERKGRERERESLRSLVCGESRAWRGSRLFFYIRPLFFYNPSAPSCFFLSPSVRVGHAASLLDFIFVSRREEKTFSPGAIIWSRTLFRRNKRFSFIFGPKSLNIFTLVENSFHHISQLSSKSSLPLLRVACWSGIRRR